MKLCRPFAIKYVRIGAYYGEIQSILPVHNLSL